MPEDEKEPSRVPAALVAAVFAVALTLYLVTFDVRSDGLILGNDVVPYARALVAGGSEGLWNPHHLLFHPAARALSEVLARLSRSELDLGHVLRAQKVLSALGGALAMALFFRFAARTAGAPRGGLLAAAFGTSAGVWLYSSVGETYMPANAALVGLLTCAIEGRLERGEVRPHRHVALGAWLLAAVLLRQDSVLVVPALALILPLRRWLGPTLAAGTLALGAYALAWRAAGTELDLVPWLRGLADTGAWGHRPDARAFAVAAGTTGTALIYALFHWRTAGIVVLLTGVAALLPPRRWSGAGRRAVIGLAVFAALRFLFFAWWQPGNMEYHTGTLIPLFLLAAMILGRPSEPRLARLQELGLVLFVLAVAIGNWLVVIEPNRGRAIEERTRAALAAAGEGGLVVSIDALQHYAVLREEPTHVEALDASPLMAHAPGGLPAALRPLRDEVLARIAAARARGANVVFVVDDVLPRRHHWSPNPIEGLSALLPPGVGAPLSTDPAAAGIEAEAPWGWIVRPGD